MKKLVSLILCFAMLLSFAGFAEDAETISVAHNQGEYIYEKFHQMSDLFTELTGVKVKWLEIPSSDWDTWVVAQFAAGTEPDVLWSVPQHRDYFDQGKLVDLTPYYDQPNSLNGKIWKDCFTEGGLINCMSNDGTRYISTAMTYATVNLYYNKTIMEELGLDTVPPKTYSEMMEMLAVAKEDGRYIPMSVMNSMGWNLTWIEDDYMDALFADTGILETLDIIVPNKTLDEGEILLGLYTGVIDYDDPRFVEYFTLMKDFTQYWNADFNAASWEYEGLFNDNKVLMTFNGGWYPGQVIQNGYDVNYGAAAKPYIDNEYSEYGVAEPFKYAPNAGEPALFVSKKCEDEGRLEAALKFLHFMTDANTGAQFYVDAVMLGTCVDGVVLPEEMISLQDVEYGEYKPSKLINCFKFNAEVGSLYWRMYTEYLDPSSDMEAAEFIEKLKEELLPYLDEAIEEYTTYDVISYADQIQ